MQGLAQGLGYMASVPGNFSFQSRCIRLVPRSPCLCEAVLASQASFMSLSKEDDRIVDHGDLCGQLS